MAEPGTRLDNPYRPYVMRIAEMQDETPDVRTLTLSFGDEAQAARFPGWEAGPVAQVSGFGAGLLDFGMVFFSLFFLLRDGAALIERLIWLSPLARDPTERLMANARDAIDSTRGAPRRRGRDRTGRCGRAGVHREVGATRPDAD